MVFFLTLCLTCGLLICVDLVGYVVVVGFGLLLFGMSGIVCRYFVLK